MRRRKKKEIDPYEFPPYRPTPVELPEAAADAVPELRSYAAFIWDAACNLFGCSRTLVNRVRAPHDFMRQARDWIGNLELLVRRMLLIMALSLKLAPVRKRKPAGPRGHARTASWSTPDSWRVTFRMMRYSKPETDEDMDGALHEPPPAPVKTYSGRTAPLARRLEALRRAISFHGAYAQRLARRLARIRAKDALANAPRVIRLKPWDFNPWRDTRGMRAIHDGMRLAQPLAERELAIWQPELLQPG